MILKERIHKESLVKFQGTLCKWKDIAHHMVNPLEISWYQTKDLLNYFREIDEENLIIPLEFLKHAEKYQKDQKGCRIYDWKVLTNQQVKRALKIEGRFERVKVPHVPMTHYLVGEIGETPIYPQTFEVYSKFLNVTYLVNDEFLQDWCNPHYEEKNVAKKPVKDCSVAELLFAVKKKLDRRKENEGRK